MMKNHTMRNGQLIQINKKFSSLKQKQKEWITSELKERYIQAMKDKNMKLHPKIRDQILYDVYDMIEEQDIWIPLGEVERYYYSKISSFVRSHRERQIKKGE